MHYLGYSQGLTSETKRAFVLRTPLLVGSLVSRRHLMSDTVGKCGIPWAPTGTQRARFRNVRTAGLGNSRLGHSSRSATAICATLGVCPFPSPALLPCEVETSVIPAALRPSLACGGCSANPRVCPHSVLGAATPHLGRTSDRPRGPAAPQDDSSRTSGCGATMMCSKVATRCGAP